MLIGPTDPEPQPNIGLIDVPVTADGDHATAQLPPPHLWMTVLISQESYDAWTPTPSASPMATSSDSAMKIHCAPGS
jgi:hypothetical protein